MYIPAKSAGGESLAAKTADGASISRQGCSDAGVACLLVHHPGTVGCELAASDDDRPGQRCVHIQASTMSGAVFVELHTLQDDCKALPTPATIVTVMTTASWTSTPELAN